MLYSDTGSEIKKTIWKDCKNMILIELIFKLISKTIC